MCEQKPTLSSLRNQDWKKVKVEIERIIKSLKHIPAHNITELNELIYARKKLVSGEIDIPLKNLNRNTKLRWKERCKNK